MCHLPISDKGWLRQYIPQPSRDQYYRFIEGVGKRLEHIKQPTPEQTESARNASFRDMMGGADAD